MPTEPVGTCRSAAEGGVDSRTASPAWPSARSSITRSRANLSWLGPCPVFVSGIEHPSAGNDNGPALAGVWSTIGWMYLDALSFLEDERDAWRPYEALAALTDEQLARPVDAVNGWSGRDLMAHLVAWQLVALDLARERAVGERSARKQQADADWEARGGEAVNDEIQRSWAERPLPEVRAEFERVSGELRGYLTVVPEARWIKDSDHQRFFVDETLDHYDEHRKDLDAIIAAVS